MRRASRTSATWRHSGQGAGREEEVWRRVEDAARRDLQARTSGIRAPVEIVVRHDAPAARVLVDLALLDQIQRSRPGLVVMPTRSRTGFSRFFVGSVTEEVVRHAAAPVLAVTDPETRPVGPYRVIVVATDLSAGSRGVFTPAAVLARRFGARVVVVHAAVEGEKPPREDDVRAFARAELGEVSARVEDGRPWRAIVHVAEEEGADLVAVARHGAHEAGDGILGSTTDRVLRHAPCPVLVG